jgi:hypothetical protein
MYKEGDCAVKDQNKALEWFKLAAAQGLEGSKAILESMVV